MGMTLRIFFIGDDDSVHRISLARYERLSRRDPDERLSEYAGKRVRCATVVLEVEGRQPVAICNIYYSIVTFDNNGRLDADRDYEEMQLVGQLLPFPLEERQPARIINAKERFLKRQYEHEYKWVPSPNLESAIIEAVFPPDTRRA